MAFRGQTKLCVDHNSTATKPYTGGASLSGEEGEGEEKERRKKNGGKKYNLE